jgi:hypothetical protein
MEITRKSVRSVVESFSGFVRLDDLVEKLGATATPENLWLALDKLNQTILPAMQTDCQEGVADTAIVLVSYSRRKQHELTEQQFGAEKDSKGEWIPAVMPPKPESLKGRVRDKAKMEEKRKILKAAGLAKDTKETPDYLPGLVMVDASWFSRDDIADTFKIQLAEYLSGLDSDDLLAGSKITFCKPGVGNSIMLTLHVPIQSDEE